MNNKKKTSTEKFQQSSRKTSNDIIQKITGLKKSNIPYNNHPGGDLVLKENTSFYKQQQNRLHL